MEPKSLKGTIASCMASGMTCIRWQNKKREMISYLTHKQSKEYKDAIGRTVEFVIIENPYPFLIFQDDLVEITDIY